MAVNFRMNTHRKENGRIVIQMTGDFDGSSAWELIHKLNEFSGSGFLIELDTSGLKHLVPFGRNVLMSHAAPLRKSISRYVVTGSKAHFLSDVRPFTSTMVE